MARPFGTIRQLPSGRWQATYPGPDGGRHRAPHTFATRRQARTWLDDVGTDLRRGSWASPDLGRQRLDEYAISWLTSRPDLKPRTRHLYAGLLDRHVLPYLGARQLRQVTPQAVRDWFAQLGESTGDTARAQSYRLLRTIMNQAVRDTAILRNPCTIPGGGSVRHAERVPATLGQVQAIADAVPPRYRMLVLAGAWSGLRLGELTALTRADVTQQPPAFTVSKSLHLLPGGEWVTTDPKTAAGRRTVHLPPHLAGELAQHLNTFVPDRPAALVFATANRTPLARSNWSATFRRAADAAGRPDLRFHDLRHTGATLAAQAGATTRELMARMGHASPAAALVYQHASHERDQALAAALSAAAASEQASNVLPMRRP